ncbi:MAG: error-prone DNA polymerase, partial [Spirochaetales bacterium]|nr:error-prone DNA polymerase [Spirochaetales bacterium]
SDRMNGIKRGEISRRFDIPLVAGTEVLYHSQEKKRLQDVLTCIKHGVQLTEAGSILKSNAEHYLKTPEEFQELYNDVPQAIEATLEIAARCQFSLDSLVYRYPSELLPKGLSTAGWLRKLTLTGADIRYTSSVPVKVKNQIETELALIEELEYNGYFITMWDIVQFCKKNDIICQGRGSAANSAVCYCLGITAIDPVQMDLLFERFISRERAEPPDIDLDIEHRRREEVIQYMYTKYGRDRAAMVANVVRYRRKSAIREVGKVLGIPVTALDMLSKLTSYRGGTVQEALDGTGLKSQGKKLDLLIELITELQDFPRHLSIHPGGFLLGSEPVSDLVPVENATMPNRTVIQWDKYDIEELGLFKVDLLGLGALHHLHHSFDLLKTHLGKTLTMAEIPMGDTATFDMLCKSDTVGVFQVESRAQMGMLPRLKPRTYYDIVIEVSIVRPGPIAGGMVHPFLKRRNGEEPVTYPHPSLEPVLKKTMGVPLFQEQVMKLAVIAAGYTPGEADQLRRDMAAWKRQGSIERHQEKLISGMLKNGISEKFAIQVFEQIRGFGEYGFPESHAASFAYIAYCTAWLKCHYPVFFTCALLNAWPMGFYSPATIVQDGKRHDIRFLPVDIMKSEWFCTLEEDGCSGNADLKYAVRMGLRFIRGLGEAEYNHIEDARQKGADSLVVFLTDSGLSSDVLINLSQSGAFESLDPNRRSSLWKALGKNGPFHRTAVNGTDSSNLLNIEETIPDFMNLNDIETVLWDHAFSGHSTNGHPLEPYRDQLVSIGLPDSGQVNESKHDTVVSYAGLVICRQLPATANGTLFITLEDEMGFVNCIVWDRTFRQFRNVILANTFLGVTGKIQAERGVSYLVVDKAWKPDLDIQRAHNKSRDFH